MNRVVDVVERVHAQALAATSAGEQVAMHCHTATGTVIVTVPLPAFLAAVRGPRDANGRPWPHPRRSNREILEADAAATRPPLLKPSGQIL